MVDMELTQHQSDPVTLAFSSVLLADVAYGVTGLILDSADSISKVTRLLENFDQLRCEVKGAYEQLMRKIGARNLPPALPPVDSQNQDQPLIQLDGNIDLPNTDHGRDEIKKRPSLHMSQNIQ